MKNILLLLQKTKSASPAVILSHNIVDDKEFELWLYAEINTNVIFAPFYWKFLNDIIALSSTFV